MPEPTAAVAAPGASAPAASPPRFAGASLGYVQILAAASLFGITGSVAKVALDAGIEPARLTALRCTGSAIGLLVVVGSTRPGLLRIERRDLPLLAALAVFGAALIQFLYFVAIDRLPVGLTLLLEFTAPLMVALFSRYFLGQAVDRRVWVALALSLTGLSLVAGVWTGDRDLDPLGVAAALGAACCLAAFYLLNTRALERVAPVALTFWMFALAAVIWAVAQPWWAFEWSALSGRTSMLGAFESWRIPVWLPVAWVVVLGTLTPYALTIASLGHLSPTTTGIVGTGEPVIAAVVAWAWLGQSLDAGQLFGAGVVLAGVVMVQTVRSAQMPVEEPLAVPVVSSDHG